MFRFSVKAWNVTSSWLFGKAIVPSIERSDLRPRVESPRLGPQDNFYLNGTFLGVGGWRQRRCMPKLHEIDVLRISWHPGSDKIFSGVHFARNFIRPRKLVRITRVIYQRESLLRLTVRSWQRASFKKVIRAAVEFILEGHDRLDKMIAISGVSTRKVMAAIDRCEYSVVYSIGLL